MEGSGSHRGPRGKPFCPVYRGSGLMDNYKATVYRGDGVRLYNFIKLHLVQTHNLNTYIFGFREGINMENVQFQNSSKLSH